MRTMAGITDAQLQQRFMLSKTKFLPERFEQSPNVTEQWENS